jgi:hypothetical protein
MNLTAPFVRRPVATTLLSLAVLLAGALAFRLLPVRLYPRWIFRRSKYPPHYPVQARRQWRRPLQPRSSVNSRESQA